MNGNKFATGQILRKPVVVVKGRILAGKAQKPPEPWFKTAGKLPIILEEFIGEYTRIL